MKLKFKKLDSTAKLPNFAHPGDAGMDIFSLEDLVIKPGERVRVRTGWAVEIPDGYVGLIWDKSSMAFNHGIKTMAGVADAGYRGEILVVLINLLTNDFSINKYDKIAQFLIQPIEHPEIVEVEELSDTSRGSGSFGSTGRQ